MLYYFVNSLVLSCFRVIDWCNDKDKNKFLTTHLGIHYMVCIIWPLMSKPHPFVHYVNNWKFVVNLFNFFAHKLKHHHEVVKLQSWWTQFRQQDIKEHQDTLDFHVQFRKGIFAKYMCFFTKMEIYVFENFQA